MKKAFHEAACNGAGAGSNSRRIMALLAAVRIQDGSEAFPASEGDERLRQRCALACNTEASNFLSAHEAAAPGECGTLAMSTPPAGKAGSCEGALRVLLQGYPASRGEGVGQSTGSGYTAWTATRPRNSLDGNSDRLLSSPRPSPSQMTEASSSAGFASAAYERGRRCTSPRGACGAGAAWQPVTLADDPSCLPQPPLSFVSSGAAASWRAGRSGALWRVEEDGAKEGPVRGHALPPAAAADGSSNGDATPAAASGTRCVTSQVSPFCAPSSACQRHGSACPHANTCTEGSTRRRPACSSPSVAFDFCHATPAAAEPQAVGALEAAILINVLALAAAWDAEDYSADASLTLSLLSSCDVSMSMQQQQQPATCVRSADPATLLARSKRGSGAAAEPAANNNSGASESCIWSLDTTTSDAPELGAAAWLTVSSIALAGGGCVDGVDGGEDGCGRLGGLRRAWQRVKGIRRTVVRMVRYGMAK